MKKVLMFSMTTAAGAGTYASTLISEDGQVKALAGWTAPKTMGITKIIPMGAAGSHSTIARSQHASDDITFTHPADTLADYDKEIPIDKMFGAGIIVEANETLTLNNIVTGNATINVLIELDDKIKTCNARGIRIAGAAAYVANVPTETGGNVAADLAPNTEYRIRGACLLSTSIQTAYAMLNGQSVALPGANAILTGQGYAILSKEAMEAMTGTGSEFAATFQLYATGTAADAANVQFYNFLLESE